MANIKGGKKVLFERAKKYYLENKEEIKKKERLKYWLMCLNLIKKLYGKEVWKDVIE